MLDSFVKIHQHKRLKMQDIEIGEIIEKLKDILASEGNRNVKTKDVAQALGINPDTFNSMKFRNSIPYPQILNFLQKRKININYFFYGISPKETLQCEDDYRILKLYKTNATLGGGGFNEEIEGLEIVFSNQILSILKANNPKLITCMGDSMEPLISGESILLLDDKKPLKNKGIFAINTRDGLFIKQVLLKENGVILHSLNPNYADCFFKNGDFLNLGEIVGEIKRV